MRFLSLSEEKLLEKLAFSAPADDFVGQAAVSVLDILQKKQQRNYPKIFFDLEKTNNKILVVFFTFLSRTKKEKILYCAAHQLYQKNSISQVTPLIIGCDPKAIEKKEAFDEAVRKIANNYCFWAVAGFPVNNKNQVFPPWGNEPKGQYLGHETKRTKSFELWQDEVDKYIKVKLKA